MLPHLHCFNNVFVVKTTKSFLLCRLEVVYRELACLDVLGDLGDNESQALQLIREALAPLESTVESTGQSSLYRSPFVHDGAIGRPKYDIRPEQLEFLLTKKITVTTVAVLLNVCQNCKA